MTRRLQDERPTQRLYTPYDPEAARNPFDMWVAGLPAARLPVTRQAAGTNMNPFNDISTGHTSTRDTSTRHTSTRDTSTVNFARRLVGFQSPANRLVSYVGILGLCVLAGCAEGPFGLARYNPVLVEEWRKDEKYGPTLHQRLEEMREWERQAGSLGADQEQSICVKLNELIRSDSNTLLVTQAVKTLGAIDSAQSLDALRFASTHPQPDVRVAACRAWGRKKSAEASETLANLLNSDTHLDVRIAAARELSGFPGQATIQTLAVALEDPDPALQRRCAESLETVTGKKLGSDVKAWREYIASGQAKPAEPVSIADRVYSWFR